MGDGEGVGDGVGVGVGDGPSVVLPIGPKRMSENLTFAVLPCADSTSAGTPDEVEHVPRAAPGSEESTGYVESSQSMFA